MNNNNRRRTFFPPTAVVELLKESSLVGSIFFYAIAMLFALLFDVNIFVRLLIAIIVLYAIVSVLRIVFFRNRPQRVVHSNLLEKIDAGSFPSMHCARSAALAVILGALFPETIFLLILAFLVLLTAISRVVQQRHYVLDVLGGVIVGIVVGLVCVLV